jgi:hypothetical protein
MRHGRVRSPVLILQHANHVTLVVRHHKESQNLKVSLLIPPDRCEIGCASACENNEEELSA